MQFLQAEYVKLQRSISGYQMGLPPIQNQGQHFQNDSQRKTTQIAANNSTKILLKPLNPQPSQHEDTYPLMMLQKAVNVECEMMDSDSEAN